MVSVYSLGGSIVAPDGVDVNFVKSFRDMVISFLKEQSDARLVFVVGGGGPARKYQQAYREINENKIEADTGNQDWIGIMATRLNAELLRSVFCDFCDDPVVTDPTANFTFTGRILIAAGWKPGFSTDFDAVMLAERFHADKVVNLSNITKVYSDDPKKNPDAVPLDTISWDDFKKLVGDTWKPGINLPFDPVATKKAAELGLTVITAGGKDLENIGHILRGEEFFGSIIGG